MMTRHRMMRRGRVRRRDVLAYGLGAAALPLAARAEPALPIVGFLSSLSRTESGRFEDAFRRGLGELGYESGRNIAIEYRWADGHYDRLPRMAAELVALSAAVIVAAAPPAALAAKAATTKIPVVFMVGYDPVRAGLVGSLNRPGGNVTGVTFLGSPLAGKRLELLREIVPGSGLVAALINPVSPDSGPDTKEVETAAAETGQRLRFLRASTEQEISSAFAALAETRASGLLVLNDPFFTNRRDQIVALASRLTLPAIYPFREFVAAGGLMSYGVSLDDSYRQAGVYAARILKGAKPADLPVLQPTKFELIINLKTAKALGLAIPSAVLLRADEVIE
jgi:putative ABC transport system substrate-binding protein